MNNSNEKVKITVLRSTGGTLGQYVDYEIPLEQEMTILQALEYIHCNLDASLGFKRYCCGVQYCGSCLMMINGHAAHACLTKLERREYLLEPLKGFRVLRDLIIGEKLGQNNE